MKILTEDETLDIALSGRSISRVGEGELKLTVRGWNLKSQPHSPELEREMRQLITTPGAALICLPRNFEGMPNEPFWRRFENPAFAPLYTLPEYGSAFISRPDMVNAIDRPDYWAKCRALWAGKDVTLVGHGLKVLRMPEAASVRLVRCAPIDAYAEIDRLEAEIGTPAGPVFLAAGCAATVLAVRLAAKGVHAIDVGHLGAFMPAAGAYQVDRASLISPAYVEQNRQLHARPEGYGGSGRKSAAIVAAFAAEIEADWILDYGCGQGTLKAAMVKAGHTGPIHEYDPAIKAKAALPKPADLVVCTDVLEHIEPEKLEAVLSHLHMLAKTAAFLLIATRPANKTLPDGRNAHLIVEDAAWWRAKVEAIGWTVLRQESKPGHDLKLWLRK